MGLPWNPCSSSSSFQPAASQPASQPASPADRSDKSMNQRIDDSQLESTNKVFYRGHMSPLTVFRRPPSQSVSQPASLVMFTIKTSTKEQIATRTLVATHPHYEYHGWILAAPPMVREHGAPPLMSSHVDPPTSDDRITTLSLGISYMNRRRMFLAIVMMRF